MRTFELVFCIVFISIAVIRASDTAEVKKFITSGCKILNNGVHFCPAGASQQRSLDPRAETILMTRIPASEKVYLYKFRAKFHVIHAKQTTIMQFLNRDLDDEDMYKPVLFLVAWVKKRKRIKLCMFETCDLVWNNVPSKFVVSFVSSGRRAKLKITGRKVRKFNLTNPTNGAFRPKGEHDVRWGVYHHDVVDGRSESRAEVRVTKIRVKGF